MRLRLVLAVTMITIGAGLAAGASTAHADATGNESCGGSVHFQYPGSWYYNAAQWSFELELSWSCGLDKTFSYEMQHSTDGGNHWVDWCCDYGHRQLTSSGGGAGVLEVPAQQCVNNGLYRGHVWWAHGNSDYATAARSWQNTC